MKSNSNTREFTKYDETPIEFAISTFQEIAQVISIRQVLKDDSESSSMQISEEDKIHFSDSVEPCSLDVIDENNDKELVTQESLLNSQISSTQKMIDAKLQRVTQVDALYELPFEGEWEELILPRSDCQTLYFLT